ncbi:hypothetical protein F5884DRAFT_898804 [Xylogone sp. PMI_703]|nr:hypothetical protein F5884DRAFT_898804 [Xylogone sp. PMI_703]
MHHTISPAILYFGTPVVLVTTQNDDGTPNISPISSAWWLGHRAVIGLDANSQCTYNLTRRRYCVLNLPSDEMADSINRIARTTGSNPVPPWKASVGYEHVKDKFQRAGLTEQASDLVPVPRIRECPVQMEAEMMETHEMMKDLPDRKGLVFSMELKILRVHIEDNLRLPGYANRVDADKWNPMIMCFQDFYSKGQKKLAVSNLAKVTEGNYRALTRSDVVKQGADTDALGTDADEELNRDVN